MATYVIHKETKQPTKLIGTQSMDLLVLDIVGEWRRESSMILIRPAVVVQVSPMVLKIQQLHIRSSLELPSEKEIYPTKGGSAPYATVPDRYHKRESEL
jgi:hypothetical protein